MKQTLSCWEHIVFDNMCNNVSSRMHTPNNSKYDRYVGLEHLDTLEPKIMRWGSSRDIKSSVTLFKEGQILFGRRNWYLRRVAVADFAGICSADIYVLEVHGDKIVHDFLPIFMHSEQFFNEVLKYSVGSMSTRVKWSYLAKIEFKIPKITEQKKIVNMVSRIDYSVTKTQRLLEKIKTYKASKADELLTRGIGHKKFKKVKWLFGKEIEIPRKWDVKKIDDVFDFLKTGTNSRKDLNEDGDLQYIHYGDIHTKWHLILDCKSAIIPYIKKDKVKNIPLLKDGDLIIADASEDHEGSGASILLKNVKNKQIVSGLHTIALRDNSQITQPEFRAYITSTKPVKTQIISRVTGISVFGLSKTNLKEIKILVPSLQEQTKIASILSRIDKQIIDTENHLSKLKMLRKSVINEKLTPPKGDKIVQ